jgi:hypothetical protein
VLRSRKHSSHLHSLNTPSWHGAQLKHRESFTFYLYFTKYEVIIYKKIIIPLRRMQVFGNKVSRRIFRHVGDKISGQFRLSHKEESGDFYRSPTIIRMVECRL